MTLNHAARSRRGLWSIMAALAVLQAAPAFAVYVTTGLNPWIQSEFHLSHVELSLLVAVFFAGTALTGVPLGWASDRFNPFLVTGATTGGVLGLGMVAAGAAPHYLVLLMLLLVAGMGFGAAAPASNVLALRLLPQRVRGRAMGAKQMGSAAGAAVAGVVLPVVAISASWRFAFVAAGLLTFGLTLAAVLFLFHQGRTRGTALPAAAVAAERVPFRLASIDRRLFRDAARHGLGSVGFIVARWGLSAYLMLFVINRLGESIPAAAAALALSQVGAVIGNMGWAVVNDHTKTQNSMRTWQVVGIISVGLMVGLTVLPRGTPEAAVLALSFFLGATVAGWTGLYMRALARDEHLAEAGTRSGIGLMVTDFGTLCGMPLVGFLMDQTHSLRFGFAFLALLIALGTAYVRIIERQDRVRRH